LDSFSVAARYDFQANFQVLGRIAEMTEVIARNLEAGAKAAQSFTRMMGDGIRPTEAFANSLGNVAAQADAATASLSRMGVAAKTASGAGGVGGGRGSSRGGGGFGGFFGGAATVGGLASLAFVASGIRGASAMQNAELQTAIATGKMGPNYNATMRNMQPTVDMAYGMSAMTGGSVVDMMRVVQNMAASGFTPSQLTSLSKPIAQLTDVLHFGKDQMSFSNAATNAAGLAHDLRLFSTADAQAGFNRLAQLGYQSPHGTTQLITQTRRFAPMFERMLPGNTQQKADQILQYTAWLDRMGTLQFGGTGLNMLATYLNHPKTNKQVAALDDLGLMSGGRNLFRDDRTGTYNLPAALAQVATRYAGAMNTPGGRGRVNDDIFSLSANASRILATLTTPDALVALRNIKTQQKGMPNLDQMQSQLMETPGHAFARFITNVQSLATTIGDKLVPPLGKIAAQLASATSGTTDFLRAHPQALSVAAGAVAIGSLYGAYRLFQMVGGIAAFAHVAAHTARESVGIGAGAYIGRGAAHAGGMLGAAGRMFGGGVGPALREVGEIISAFGPKVVFMRGGFELLGGAIARLGLRAIPVVGNITLIIDAIQQFVKHGTDINFALGKASRWMDDFGKPMLVSAITKAWTAAVQAVLQSIPRLLGFARDSLGNMFSGGTGSGVQGMGAALGKWIMQQQAANDAAYAAGYGPKGNAVNHFYGNIVLPGVKDGNAFAAAMKDYRHQNARAGASGATPFAPAFLSSGLATGH
jgi:hypothetical protein